MKVSVLSVLAGALLLSACNAPIVQKVTGKKHEPMVGMANPASVFCEKQGGKSVTKKDANGGEYGVCQFADGKTVDEWDYYRQHNKK